MSPIAAAPQPSAAAPATPRPSTDPREVQEARRATLAARGARFALAALGLPSSR